MICCACGEPAVISREYEDMCQFCFDSLCHELRIRLDAVRDFGEQHYNNCGPNFGATYYTGEYTLGYGLYVARFPREAMNEALRTAERNNWILLRLDIQGGSSRRLRQQTCSDIFVSKEWSKYMQYSYKDSLSYDEVKYGILEHEEKQHAS